MSENKVMNSEELQKLFENEDFDPITYINNRFPDENSLLNLDAEINLLDNELNSMNQELISAIHSHALLNTELKSEIQQANQTTIEVIREIQVIKEKAEKSENLVYEMCKDIKQLDTAKKNLTFSITALKKFIMQMTAIDQLRDCCKQKNYKEVSNLISAFDELAQYFKKYENIQQIQDLFKEKEDIIRDLRHQLLDDFISFGKQASTLTNNDMQDACSIVESLGQNFKNEVVRKICGMVLDGYVQAFNQAENKNLDKYERRFAWISRNLKEFENRWNGIFPEYWGIQCHLIYEFCSITRINIYQILESTNQQDQQDVSHILKALQLTLNYEQKFTKDLEKRYMPYLKQSEQQQQDGNNNEFNQEEQKSQQLEEEKQQSQQIQQQQQKQNQEKDKTQFMITRLPKFKGSISDSFEQYLRPYVQLEERDIVAYITKVIQEDQIDQDSELKVFTSSLFMFNYIKTLIKRASQYSRTAIFFDITKVIQKSLKMYSDDLGNGLMREEKNKNKNITNFIQMICFGMNTAEYCKETLIGLEESIKQNLDSPFQEQVDLGKEDELFVNVINKGIEIMQNHIQTSIEVQFNLILKQVNYGILDDAQEKQKDTSELVTQIKGQITTHVQTIKGIISEVYLIFYLNKLVVMVNKKILDNVYKFKKFSENILPVITFDCIELENCLNNLGKIEENKPNTSYNNFVQKTFLKTKNILKLLCMPSDSFVENFSKFYPDATIQDLQKLLNIKGIVNQEIYQNLAKSLQKNNN